MYEVKTVPRFDKALKALSPEIAERILEKVSSALAKDPLSAPPMRNMPEKLKGVRKYRVGKWRIFYFVRDREVILYLVDNRDTIYDY